MSEDATDRYAGSDDELVDRLVAAIDDDGRPGLGSWTEFITRTIRDHPRLARLADQYGEFPLHVAAGVNHTPAVTELLKTGADVDSVSGGQEAQTPLHRAACSGARWAIMQLVEAGADLTLRDGLGLTPLMSAIYSRNRDEPVGTLLLLGAPVDLRAAVNLRQEGLVRLLLRDDPNAARTGPDAASLAGEAARQFHPGVMRALLEAGADPDARGLAGYPLDCADERGGGGRACVELLLAFGAKARGAQGR